MTELQTRLARAKRPCHRKAICVAFAVAAPGLVGSADAIVRLHTLSDSDYINYGNTFPATGKLIVSNGHVGATLVSPQWVVTAAHGVSFGVTPVSMTIGGNTYGIDSYFAHPNYDGNFLHGYDIGLVKLDAPVPNVTPAIVYTGSGEMNQLGSWVGVGATGVGNNATRTFDQVKRAGTNFIDADGTVFPSGTFSSTAVAQQYVLSDFDDPSNADTVNTLGTTVVTQYEMGLYFGDSGGGMYVDFGQGPVLVGVNSFMADGADPGTTANASYSDAGAAIRVAPFSSWILTTVPEPAGASLIVLAAAAGLRRRRAR